MAQPTRAQQHVDARLTNMSVALFQDPEGFVADKVFPQTPVKKQSDQYVIYNAGDFNRDEAQRRAPATESEGGGYRLSDDTYFAHKYGYHKDVTEEDRANSDTPLDADIDAVEFVTQKMLLARESQFHTTFWQASTWSADYEGKASGATGTQFLHWNDAAATPIKNVEAWKLAINGATGFNPNTMVMGPEVFSALKDCPDILDRIQYGGTSSDPAKITAQAIASLFEVDKLLVPRNIVNTAKKGVTDTTAFRFGKELILLYVDPRGRNKKAPTAGRIFSWTGLLGSSAYATRINRIPMDLLGIGTERIEGELAFANKVVSAALGSYAYTVVA